MWVPQFFQHPIPFQVFKKMSVEGMWISSGKICKCIRHIHRMPTGAIFRLSTRV